MGSHYHGRQVQMYSLLCMNVIELLSLRGCTVDGMVEHVILANLCTGCRCDEEKSVLSSAKNGCGLSVLLPGTSS